MSLRLKIVLLLAVLAATATAAIGVVSYRTTRHELDETVARSLDAAAARTASRAAPCDTNASTIVVLNWPSLKTWEKSWRCRFHCGPSTAKMPLPRRSEKVRVMTGPWVGEGEGGHECMLYRPRETLDPSQQQQRKQ